MCLRNGCNAYSIFQLITGPLVLLKIICFLVFRWGIVNHGAIDGYSRLGPYLFSGNDNRAATVLQSFVPACMRFCVPAQVRPDHGKENIHVDLFMNMVNGEESNAILTGLSGNNKRIERLLKDVFEQVIQYFYILFCQMEDNEILDIDLRKHIFSIHFVLIPIINTHQEVFRNGWNKQNTSPFILCFYT